MKISKKNVKIMLFCAFEKPYRAAFEMNYPAEKAIIDREYKKLKKLNRQIVDGYYSRIESYEIAEKKYDVSFSSYYMIIRQFTRKVQNALKRA